MLGFSPMCASTVAGAWRRSAIAMRIAGRIGMQRHDHNFAATPSLRAAAQSALSSCRAASAHVVPTLRRPAP